MARRFSSLIPGLALALSVASAAPGQSSALPETYSFVSTNSMVGPEMTVKVNRNGSKELIERTVNPKPGSSNQFHDRVLYDFQAHRLYTVDLNSHLCSTQVYTSAYAPSQLDPIGGASEMQSQLAANPPKQLAVEVVNGIRAKVVESASAEMRTKLWLDEKFSFMVKVVLTIGSGPQTLAFEMRQLSYAPSAASLFTPPSGCAQIGGESSATGGHAEMSVAASASGTASLGGSNVRAGAPAKAASGPDPLIGKWDFTGKDSAGVAWQGTLTIGAVDTSQFDPSPKYNHMCGFDMQSANSGRGLDGPCLIDPKARTLSLVDSISNQYSYTAVLSPDGKSLVEGRWRQDKSAGTWSARLSGAGTPKAGPPPSPASIAPQSNPLAKVTAVNLKATEVPYDGPCGKKLQVSGAVTTDGPATVWYRFYSNIGGVEFSEGQNGTVTLSSAGTATLAKDATFTQNKSGELRIQAAAQNADGRHGGVTISNVIPFRVVCSR